MDRVAELVKERGQVMEKLEKLNAELAQELGLQTGAAPKLAGEKRGRKPKTEVNSDDASTATSNKKSLKEVVKEILGRNPDGLVLKDITIQVEDVIKKGEYTSKATNTSAVVAQAVNALKVEHAIDQHKESKKYSLAKAE